MTFLRRRHWLTRIAFVYPGEAPALGLCAAVNLLISAGIMFGRNARDSLFLVYFGVQYLPYMYFANAAALVACSLVYTALVGRIERARLLGSVCLLFAVSLTLSRLVLLGRPHWFFPILYIEAQVIWIFSLMQFWTFAGDLFDTRQAKRLYPAIGVGALVGMISVGLVSRKLIRAVGAENLLLVWALLIFIALVLGSIAYRRYRKVEDPPKPDLLEAARVKPSEIEKIKRGLQEVYQEPLQRSLAGYVLLLWTVFSIVDFCYSKTVRARYPDPNELATFLGQFVGVQGLLCLAVQILLTRAVIARLGVGTTINFHPATLILGSAWMSIRYGFPSVVLTKLGDATMLYTFSDSSYQLLYSPIPPDRRALVRGVIEGYIRPLSLAAAGVLILGGANYLEPLRLASGAEISTGQQLSWGAFVLAAVWLSAALTAKRGYVRALVRNLQDASPTLRQAAAHALSRIKQPAAVRAIAVAIRTASPETAAGAIGFLEDLATPEATEAIAGLLSHRDPSVRAAAAKALGRLAPVEYADRLLLLLQDPDDGVRARAVEALAAGRAPEMAAKVRPLISDASFRVRAGVIIALANIEGPGAAKEWLPAIRDLAHGDAASRTLAIHVLGHLPFEESEDLLQGLLQDADSRIRSKAAKALGRVGSARAIPSLTQALAGSPELRHTARHSLSAIVRGCGRPCFESLEESALKSDHPEIRSQLADVLGRLKSFEVVDTLIALLKDPEWRVRWKVLKSFERLSRTGPLPESARSALYDYADQELAVIRQNLIWSHTLVPTPSDDAERLLQKVLEDDCKRIEERVFRALGILAGRDQMQAIFKRLTSGDARQRADALEALDNLAPKPLGQQMLAILEARPWEESVEGGSAESAIAGLAKNHKPWIRACAAYYLGFHPGSTSFNLLTGLLEDANPDIRETALYAGWLAYGKAWMSRVEAALESPDSALRRCAQRISCESSKTANTAAEGGQVMLLDVEKVLFLKSAPLFADLDSEELAALADITAEHEFKPGEIIFKEGQAPDDLYILVRGKVEVFRQIGSTAQPIAILGEKECVGEMGILDDVPRSATVRAIEPTLALRIGRESFRELIIEQPQISFAIFRILCSRLRHKNLEAEHLASTDSGRHYA